MLFEVVVFLSLLGQGDSVYCSKYSSYLGVYYTACSSGYCTGSYGYQICNYFYTYYYYYYKSTNVLSGGAIAGVVIGVFVGIAIFVAIVIVCIKNQTRGSVGTVIAPIRAGADIAIVNTTSIGYNQPFYSAPPLATLYNYGYQNPQQISMVYPPVGPQGFSAPTQPQYNPTYSYMPQAHNL